MPVTSSLNFLMRFSFKGNPLPSALSYISRNISSGSSGTFALGTSCQKDWLFGLAVSNFSLKNVKYLIILSDILQKFVDGKTKGQQNLHSPQQWLVLQSEINPFEQTAQNSEQLRKKSSSTKINKEHPHISQRLQQTFSRVANCLWPGLNSIMLEAWGEFLVLAN